MSPLHAPEFVQSTVQGPAPQVIGPSQPPVPLQSRSQLEASLQSMPWQPPFPMHWTVQGPSPHVMG
jgi:hypothetical protein